MSSLAIVHALVLPSCDGALAFVHTCLLMMLAPDAVALAFVHMH